MNLYNLSNKDLWRLRDRLFTKSRNRDIFTPYGLRIGFIYDRVSVCLNYKQFYGEEYGQNA